MNAIEKRPIGAKTFQQVNAVIEKVTYKEEKCGSGEKGEVGVSTIDFL